MSDLKIRSSLVLFKRLLKREQKSKKVCTTRRSHIVDLLDIEGKDSIDHIDLLQQICDKLDDCISFHFDQCSGKRGTNV